MLNHFGIHVCGGVWGCEGVEVWGCEVWKCGGVRGGAGCGSGVVLWVCGVGIVRFQTCTGETT